MNDRTAMGMGEDSIYRRRKIGEIRKKKPEKIVEMQLRLGVIKH